MKRLMPVLLAFTLWTSVLWSAPQLEIHHINVVDGDATIIAVKDDNGQYVFKMLIDGGKKSGNDVLIPYIKDVGFPGANNLTAVSAAVLFGGDDEPLVGEEAFSDLDVKFQAEELDPAGIAGPLDEPAPEGDAMEGDGGEHIDCTNNLHAEGPAGMEAMDEGDAQILEPNLSFNVVVLSHYHSDHYNGLIQLFADPHCRIAQLFEPGGGLKGSHRIPPTYEKAVKAIHDERKPERIGMNQIEGDIKIEIVGANELFPPITLTLVAHNGRILSKNGLREFELRDSANDRSMAWVLECGEFRYFTAGDMAGEDHNKYTDHESTLATYLEATYPHICAFKASHHGSAHSNHEKILVAMNATVCVTSSGSHGSWKFPRPLFIERLSHQAQLAQGAAPPEGWRFGVGDVRTFGFFFTNWKKYGVQKVYDGYNLVRPEYDIERAKFDFSAVTNKVIAYNSDFIIEVPLSAELETKSVFYVRRTPPIIPGTELRMDRGVMVSNCNADFNRLRFDCHEQDLQTPPLVGDTPMGGVGASTSLAGRGNISNETGPRTGSLLNPLIK